MRTTLAIDDDVLAAARHLADSQKRTIGEVISDLARQALVPTSTNSKTRNGILLMPRQDGAPPATLEIIKQLDNETP